MNLAMDEMIFWEHQDSATTLVAVDLNDILEEYLPPQILGSIRGRGSLVPDQESWLENILQEFEKEWAHTFVPRTIADKGIKRLYSFLPWICSLLQFFFRTENVTGGAGPSFGFAEFGCAKCKCRSTIAIFSEFIPRDKEISQDLLDP